MVEKICSHCGATVLVGLDYCPSCLHSARSKVAARVAEIEAKGTRIERLQAKWDDFVAWFGPSNTPTAAKNDPSFAYKKSGVVWETAMSDPYTRVVCPKCLRPHRAPLHQPPSAQLICTSCFHQFPASMAAEFRKGADLNCIHCGVTTFCVNGLKVNRCPNCEIHIDRPHDPEKTKLVVLASSIAFLVFVGFSHAVATQTMPQFLLWLCVGSVFMFFGFIAMAALGF